jgi:hypothetical protein
MKSLHYIAPELEAYLVAAERGYGESMLEHPTVDPEQDW